MENLKYNLSVLQEKAKERTVKTQSIEYDIETLIKKLDKNVIKLDPEYQRRHRWDNKTSSRLIESLILNIPIPTIYISQDVDVDVETDGEEFRYSVIDGQQRLTAIKNYLKNKFVLEGLESLNELNGCFYKDLPPFLTRRLEERSIKCLRIDSTIDSQVKLDIFERLNSGSVKLEAQELRNAVYSGHFNNLIKDLSKNQNFRELLQISNDTPDNNNKVKKMEDVEVALRFFALTNNRYIRFKKTKEKGFSSFLDETMEEFNNLSQLEIEEKREEFEKTMAFINKNYGKAIFSKYKIEEGNAQLVLQSKFNIAVYDAFAIAIHDALSEGIDISNKKEELKKLFRDKEFYNSISGSYLDTNKLKYRIETTKQVLGCQGILS
ncbi:DUF262 domain-containing protein [Chryseobacterium sp. OV279]|uniref:DUF262 domain-containing protein n=1 Tax=Chryseobacterium sp. OV279 TaxID=1500285 RepID=UPI000918F4BC|nr:DUF262 domain-containing protein [Chryseobacterium sp. OV279]SHF60178.1 Protein of unknown function DUF262 [Chryseobacterium sp. OV279]